MFNQDALSYYRSLARVDQYVRASLSEPLTLEKVARVACLERKYFSAFFRSKTGITFREWLRRLRVQRALRLMVSCDESIARVAYAVGYEDVRTFERAFKQLMGTTPIAYKASVRPESRSTPQLPRIVPRLGSFLTTVYRP